MTKTINDVDRLLAEGVRLVSNPETVVAHVVGVKVDEEPVAGDAAATAEPEVAAKKGKKEDEVAPPAGGDKGKKK